jgi:hypothetical protein
MDIFYPIKLFADFATYSVFSIPEKSHLGDAVNFFIYDSIKIIILLMVIIFAVSIIRSFLSPERIRRILAHKRGYFGNVLAACIGIVTPFCSCSAVPLFLGFVEAGVPLGVTFSFLVASPMINEVAVVLLLGMFGWKIALIYIVSGLVISIISGIALGKFRVERLLEDFVLNNMAAAAREVPRMSWKDRIDYARGYTFDILKKVWIYVLVGIGVGAWIHGYVPTDFLARYAGAGTWYAVPVAVLVGIPLYSNAAGVIPLVSALTEKGVALGTALAFMMAVTALSLPEFVILKRVMKVRLLLIYAGVVGAGIIFTGYLFNIIMR